MDSDIKNSKEFHLREESSTFSTRSKDIFGSLDKIEKKHDEKQKEADDKEEPRKEQRALWKEDPEEDAISSKRSQFKRPYSRPPSSRGSKFRRVGNRTPDYKLNPKNWTMYSLEDVQTSESSNTSAAFAFLEERRRLREAEEMMKNPETEDPDGKIVFKRPSKHSGGVNRFSSKRSKDSNLKNIEINHLGADDSADGNDELVEKKETDTVVIKDLSSTSDTSQSSGISFKKASRKRNIRVRDADDDETETG